MTKHRTEAELKQLIDDETEASEATRDEPMVNPARRNPNRTKLFATRFTPEEFEQIQQAAQRAGTPASVLVRDLVLAGVSSQQDGSVEQVVESLDRDVQRLKRQLVA